MKPSALASGSHLLICPICEAGELRSGSHPKGVQCPTCGYAPSRAVLQALRQIISLPDALGSHACEECGHPEMRRLPDGVSHCPGCGSEVLPARSVEVRSGAARFRVRVQAPSTRKALGLVAGRYPKGEVRVVFPIEPEGFFVEDPVALPEMVGAKRVHREAARGFRRKGVN